MWLQFGNRIGLAICTISNNCEEIRINIRPISQLNMISETFEGKQIIATNRFELFALWP